MVKRALKSNDVYTINVLKVYLTIYSVISLC